MPLPKFPVPVIHYKNKKTVGGKKTKSKKKITKKITKKKEKKSKNTIHISKKTKIYTSYF